MHLSSKIDPSRTGTSRLGDTTNLAFILASVINGEVAKTEARIFAVS